MNYKEKIRQKMLRERNRMPEELRQKKSKMIQARLQNLSLFENATHILFYYSFGSEADTVGLLKKQHKNKNLFIPHMEKGRIDPMRYKGETYLKKGYGGIPEPLKLLDGGEKEGADRLDLILVPGVAFDHKGARLGFGRGHYDRYLKKRKTVPKIGLAFQEQMVDSIPLDPYDVPVDIVVTDETIYICNPKYAL